MKTIFNLATSNIWNAGIIIWIILDISLVILCTIKTLMQKETLEGTESLVEVNKSIRFFGTGAAFMIITFLLSMIISLILFTLSTAFVEYPMGGVVYKKDKDGKWNKYEGRVFHSLLGGEEETKTIYRGFIEKPAPARLSENSPFIVRYHVKEEDIPLYLEYIPNTKSNRAAESFIQRKSYKLFFINKLESLVDDSKRKKIFQDYYEPFGITIDSVDFP